MKIIVLSGSAIALPLLQQLHTHRCISALICPQDTIAGDSAALLAWAAETGLPWFTTNAGAVEHDINELIQETLPDMLLTYGFPYALPLENMERTTFGSWNIHFALLPANEGTITIHQIAYGIGEPLFQHHSRHRIATDKKETALQQLSAIAAQELSSTAVRARSVVPVYRYFAKML